MLQSVEASLTNQRSACETKITHLESRSHLLLLSDWNMRFGLYTMWQWVIKWGTLSGSGVKLLNITGYALRMPLSTGSVHKDTAHAHAWATPASGHPLDKGECLAFSTCCNTHTRANPYLPPRTCRSLTFCVQPVWGRQHQFGKQKQAESEAKHTHSMATITMWPHCHYKIFTLMCQSETRGSTWLAGN